MELKKPKEATRALEVLIKIDRKEDKKWKDTLYYVLSKDYSKQNTLKILEKKSKKSRYWLIKLAQYNFSVKEYREASTVYMELFSSEQNPHKKTTYFYKAIESLNAGKYPQYAVALAKSQESYYFDNPKVRRYILRLYIGNAALKNAAILSLKILKEYQ
jgi:predicted HTH transcriptional regulator